jgi:hypothetical protein
MKFMLVLATVLVGALAQAATHPVQQQYASTDDPNRKVKTVREKAKDCPFQHARAQKLSAGGTAVATTPTDTRVHR